MSQLTLNGDTSNYIAVLTPTTITASWSLTLPQAAPASNNSFLTSSTAGIGTWTASTGTGSVVLSTSPTLTTPAIAGSSSGVTSIASANTSATNYTATLPAADFTVGYINVPQNSKTANYTTVLTDSGKHIYANGTSITVTIDSNTNVAYAIGTVLTFVNINSTSLSIGITSDTMYLAGSGTTGTRTLAQYGMATALKLTSTTWLISGTGLS